MRRPKLRELVHTMAFDFPVILDLSKPSVTLHKNGKFLLFKANDLMAADVLRELRVRLECTKMRPLAYFGLKHVRADYVDESTGKTYSSHAIQDWDRVELWKHLNGDVGKHPLCEMLRSYGVEVGTSPTLQNYIIKEHRRRQLEETPYPASPIVNENVTLFERCNPGTPLLCVKSFWAPGVAHSQKPLFEKGKRYLVASSGETEGCDQIQICHEPITSGANLHLVGKGKLHAWTEMDPAMEEWFDDTENVDFGQTIDQAYPERVKRQQDRIAKLAYVREAVEAGKKHPLYEHVRLDAAMESLKRGVINCKLMRMGKTSEAITICELWGSQKIGIVGTRNVRLAWRKEMQRLGIKNWVFVNRLSDLQKEGKYYLFTLDFLKAYEDPSATERKNYENYLRPSERKVRRKVGWSTEPQEITVLQHNPCPHCGNPMERPLLSLQGVTDQGQGLHLPGSQLCPGHRQPCAEVPEVRDHPQGCVARWSCVGGEPQPAGASQGRQLR